MSNLLPLVFAEGGPRRALRALYPLISADAPIVDIHVAYEGSWEGHHSGPFSLDRNSFEQCVANFEASPNPVPLDYEHATVSAMEAPACGWVQSLTIKTDDEGRAHLWAKVELSDKAADYIKAGAYRFSSGVFEFDSVDRVTGEEVGCVMSSLALTNSPFIAGQTPIQLSRRAAALAHSTGDQSMQKLTKEALLAALDQFEGDEIDMAQLEAAAALAAVKDGAPEEEPAEVEEAPMASDMPAEEEDPEAAAMGALPTDEEEPAAMSDEPAGEVAADDVPLMDGEPDPMAADQAMAALAPLMEASGLDLPGLAAALSENLDSVLAALSGALDAPAAEAPLSDKAANLALSARDEVITRQQAQIAELSAYRRGIEEREADAAVQSLIDDGRILGTDKDEWRALALSNRKQFDRLADGLRRVVPLGAHAGNAKTSTATVEIDEGDAFVLGMRRNLSSLPRDVQDEAIRRALSSARSGERV